jgi:hypothetical protein
MFIKLWTCSPAIRLSSGAEVAATRYIHFADTIVAIHCRESPLQTEIDRHLHHCLGEPGAAAVEYNLSTSEPYPYQLRRAGSLLYRGGDRTLVFERLLQDLTMMLITHGRRHLIFHAAGVAAQGRGLILAGLSGSGKSTLTAWLTATGCSYLTDELIAIPFSLDAIVGLPRSILLKAGSAFVWQRWLAESTAAQLSGLASGAVLVEPDQLQADAVALRADLGRIIFPHYQADSQLQIRPLSTAETCFRLLGCLLNARNLPEGGLPLVKQLAQQRNAFEIRYSDITEITHWLKNEYFSAGLADSRPS